MCGKQVNTLQRVYKDRVSNYKLPTNKQEKHCYSYLQNVVKQLIYTIQFFT